MLDELKIEQCTITLTRSCNLRCSFCYAKGTDYRDNDIIEYDNLTKLIDFCDEANTKFIVFTGGEPLLYPRFIDVLKYIRSKEKKMITTIATNGIALDDINYCKELLNNGLGYIDVSLKGKDGNTCVETTGIDCFSQQMKAIRNLSILPIEFTCSMVLTWENISTFCDVVRKARENGAKQFSFTFVIDNEKSNLSDSVYFEKYNPFSLIDSFVSQIDVLNSIIDDWWIEYSFPMCFYSKEQLSLLKGKLAAPCHIHGGKAVTFDTNMNLLPCNMYLDNKMGRFGVDFSSYKEFEEFARQLSFKRIKATLNALPSETCSKCKYLDCCYGGCPIVWKNYSFDYIQRFKSAIDL